VSRNDSASARFRFWGETKLTLDLILLWKFGTSGVPSSVDAEGQPAGRSCENRFAPPFFFPPPPPKNPVADDGCGVFKHAPELGELWRWTAVCAFNRSTVVTDPARLKAYAVARYVNEFLSDATQPCGVIVMTLCRPLVPLFQARRSGHARLIRVARLLQWRTLSRSRMDGDPHTESASSNRL